MYNTSFQLIVVTGQLRYIFWQFGSSMKG